MSGALKALYACLTCNEIMEAGRLMTKPNSPHLHCPFCDSFDLHPIGREPVTLTEYHGEIGTRN